MHLAVLVDQAVAEVEEEGDEAGGGDNAEDEEGRDVGWPDWLSLPCWTELEGAKSARGVANVSSAMPKVREGSRK